MCGPGGDYGTDSVLCCDTLRDVDYHHSLKRRRRRRNGLPPTSLSPCLRADFDRLEIDIGRVYYSFILTKNQKYQYMQVQPKLAKRFKKIIVFCLSFVCVIL